MSEGPKMTPWRLMLWRGVNLTIGRRPAFGRWLKRRLSRRLIRESGAPYCQCAGFFEYDQLDRPPRSRGGEAS
ncbi:MAG: hypothetical protein KJ621_17895 [Proteobacteria bacterium]|nr:hypothetical protein [Pseudomonadota bacterium]